MEVGRAVAELTATQADDLCELTGTRCSNTTPVVAESLLDRLINTSHQVSTCGTQSCN